MKNSTITRIRAAVIAAWSLLSMVAVHADSDSALSNRTAVNTLDLYPVTKLNAKLTSMTKADGRTFVGRATPRMLLAGSSTQPVHLRLVIPRFSAVGGGWGPGQAGLGAFYGMEVLYSGSTGDQLYYKVGGLPPSTSTRKSEWKPLTPNSILNKVLDPGIYYFKVAFASSSPTSSKFALRYQSARFCLADGGPVTALDSSRSLWLVIHGRKDGENNFRELNSSFRRNAGGAQVVSVDWASGAEPAPGWWNAAPNGVQFINLAENLSSQLESQGFRRDRVNVVAHSWGTFVGYELAKSLGSVGNFIAMDPTKKVPAGYDAGPVNFGKISRISTGVKGGDSANGGYGDEAKTVTCDFTLRLFSQNHSGAPKDRGFYHRLPVDWCASVLTDKVSAYRAFFKTQILLRQKTDAKMPWGAYRKLAGDFDLECYGSTNFDDNPYPAADVVNYKATRFLLFRKPSGVLTEARASKAANGSVKWTYRRH